MRENQLLKLCILMNILPGFSCAMVGKHKATSFAVEGGRACARNHISKPSGKKCSHPVDGVVPKASSLLCYRIFLF